MYTLEISRQAARALRQMGRIQAARIEAKLNELARHPYAAHLDVERLQDRSGYRLRIGDWRVLYDIDDRLRGLSVEDVRQRGSAYR